MINKIFVAVCAILIAIVSSLIGAAVGAVIEQIAYSLFSVDYNLILVGVGFGAAVGLFHEKISPTSWEKIARKYGLQN